MHARKRITRLGNFIRNQKKTPLKPLPIAQVAVVSLVAFLSVGAIVFIAQQAAPSADAAPVVTAVAKKAASPAPPVRKAKAASARPTNAAAAVPEPAVDAVTITGCLEQDHDSFKLKDTSGADAPKSRNWKTGFLGKRSSSLTVVDAASRLKLGTHVGERVSVTGPLVDRELQGRSLQRVAASCE